MDNRNIYAVGGTVQASAGLYLARKSDDELLQYCINGEYAYVLTSRQMGKSSLMVKTSEELEQRNIISIIIDLTEFGVLNKSAEQWYLDLLVQIAEQITETDVLDWWKKNSHLGVNLRFSSFLEEIVKERKRQIVVFIDEIDTTLGLDFGDDFFALIRYLHNARAKNSYLKALSFVLLGVATPSQLISDTSRTPFNIGRGVELTDFTLDEALPLAKGLRLPQEDAETALKIILDWSSGHPYLTQYICRNFAERISDAKKTVNIRDLVEDVVHHAFFTEEEKQNNHNIKFVRDYLINAKDGIDVLEIYSQIRNGRNLLDDARNGNYATLKLSGIVKADKQQNLLVRNKIYQNIFDSVWAQKTIDQLVLSSKKSKADIFISYSHSNEYWIINYLLPYLESMNLKFMIDYIDFVLGQPYYQNTENALKSSKYILLILSPGWMASEQNIVTQIMLNLSSTESPEKKIIPIILEKCEIPLFISDLEFIDFTKDASNAWRQLSLALDVPYISQKNKEEDIRSEIYRQAEKKIEETRRSGATYLDLSVTKFTDIELPRLTELPESLGSLTHLRSLNLSNNQLASLPDFLVNLKQLQTLDLFGNQLTDLPEWIGSLSQLKSLNLTQNLLTNLPDSLGHLYQLQELNISQNQLTKLPQSLQQLLKLVKLQFAQNKISMLPQWLTKFTELNNLAISYNPIKTIPDWLETFTHIRNLSIMGLHLQSVPNWIISLKELEILSLSENEINFLPDWLGSLTQLSEMHLDRNLLYDLPPFFIRFEHLKTLQLSDNPLNPELAEAYKQGFAAVQVYLRAKISEQITLNEAKLIFIGEGEVGKTCLMDALLDEEWQERATTHGIDIKPIKLINPDTQTEITLNGWDFGGQRVYRPTHQLFFSAPAIYLVIWKPREGPQQGFVKEWIQLVKRREPDAKILVVATHGGPQQRQPDIDRQELWDLFGRETVADFFFVDSKPDAHGKRKGIEELKLAIARLAAQLPEVGRSVPKSFQDVREALQARSVPYLPLDEVLAICRAHNMDDEVARLFITISHRLGHLTHYQHDRALRDIVILRPYWLATAISYVLDDESTRTAHGLVRFSRLAQLWDDPTRAAYTRYPATLHLIFLRLMERFDLSYRVADSTPRGESDPQSLIAQLIPDNRPENFASAWTSSPSSGDLQQTQICRIVDNRGNSAPAEGLFYQLIVRLHKYSLGRVHYADSVHWQRGLVLDDDYNGRALLEHKGNDVHITVRAPYPERFLAMLTGEVKFLVESFWEGLRCDVMVPCLNPIPCIGLFEVQTLIENKKRGRPEQPCSVCNEWQNIDSLLLNAPAARPVLTGEALTSQHVLNELSNLRQILIRQNEKTLGRFDNLDSSQKELLSKADASYNSLMQTFTDEAKEGPRLFNISPVNIDFLEKPMQFVSQKFRVWLWCEHSQLPLFALNKDGDMHGIYELDLPYEWVVKAAPYLKALTATLSLILPVASSATKLMRKDNLMMSDKQYKSIEKQLAFGKDVFDSILKGSEKLTDWNDKSNAPDLPHGAMQRAEGALLRELHSFLKEKDPGFGGLVRVINKRQEFMWVHERFASEY